MQRAAQDKCNNLQLRGGSLKAKSFPRVPVFLMMPLDTLNPETLQVQPYRRHCFTCYCFRFIRFLSW